MKQFYRDLCLAIFAACLAFGLCWFVCNPSLFDHHHTSQVNDPHQWLHDNLQITEEQEARLMPFEESFTKRKKELEGRIALASHELAMAIHADGKYSERVKEAAFKIHQAQGELQKATLDHLFDMHTILTPEQKKKLNLLATQALSTHP